MASQLGGYDTPYYAGAVRMGRNKEIVDDFTLLAQAHEAIARSRKDVSSPLATSIGNVSIGRNRPKTVTSPPLSV